jgi:hypothetical protein
LFRNDNSPLLDDDALKIIIPLSKTIPLSCFLLIDSYVVQRLDSSMQEASKHVARLKDQNFVEKNPSDGYYILTTLGKLVTKPASIPTLHVDTFI